jgi:predicted HD superfamily hydrolase involved in NAD metabolism
MNYEEIVAIVQRDMPVRRWSHTQGVIQTSIDLARWFGANPEKAQIAAALHDVAKYWPVEQQRMFIESENPANDVLQYDKQLWHAHAGAHAANVQFGIEDPEILNAIRYHTSGRIGMSLLEKVVCLADYIEPGRDYPGVDQLRLLAKEHLELALIAGLDNTMRVLIEQGKRIYPLTLLARNDLIQSITQEV